YALLAMLDTSAQPAIDWFVECVALDPVLLGTNYIELFVHHAGLRDYLAIQPVLRAMLQSDDNAVSETAARQSCLLALTAGAAAGDAGTARSGTVAMRKGAVRVYANNVTHVEVGAECRQLLLPFFADPDDEVRTRAARAFHYVADLDRETQATLLGAFLDAKP